MSARALTLVILPVLLVAAAAPAGASRLLLSETAGPDPWLQATFLRPSFAGEVVDFYPLSGMWRLELAVPFGGGAVLASLPVAHFGWEVDYYNPYVGDQHYEGSASQVGNLFLGVQMGLPTAGAAWTGARLGVHLPTTGTPDPEGGGVLMMAADADPLAWYRYYPHFLTLDSSVMSRIVPAPGVTLGIEVGPHVMVPTGDRTGDAQVFLHHGAYVEVAPSMLALSFEIAGQVWFGTGGGDPVIDHVAAFGAGLDLGRVEPRLFLALPLSEPTKDEVDYELGLQCRLDLGP